MRTLVSYLCVMQYAKITNNNPIPHSLAPIPQLLDSEGILPYYNYA